MSSLALYRTYRPGRFADVVGQEHVTVPLMRALANDRVHHAYLFSGPRGCGKTSSARILARSLNCAQGPTAEPCEQCQSCRDLAPNGPGNIDVIELDAATHGLVDDARELREKAHFAPASSRYKIYIIDEAHQLGPGAANALLKLIEEPPAHVKFIFATTAPDKIIGTIRSRTYHYPFRLIPAKILQQNLTWICEQEGVPIEPAAVALVARAGAGSARDAQSILGQLIAGAGDDGVTYDLAVALLGFTDAALLDQVVDAIAADDASSVYSAVDQVMNSGHDPRRFLTDLLERFRDLVVLRAVPDAAESGLLDVPPDQAARMAIQAGQFGPHDLIRLAAVVDEGITAMKGTTPTRLQLELVCGRLLLPGADDSVAGVQARLDRLERRLTTSSAPTAEAASESPNRPAQGRPAPTVTPEPTASPTSGGGGRDRGPADPDVASPTSSPEPVTEPEPEPEPVQASAPKPEREPESTAPGSIGVADVRRLWPDVLARLKEIKRTPWSLISQESMVTDVSDGVLTLAFKQSSLRDTFARRTDFQDCLRQAIKDVLFLDMAVEAIVDPSAGSTGGSRSDARPAGEDRAPATRAQPAGDQRRGGSAPAPVDRSVSSTQVSAASVPDAVPGGDEFDVDPNDADLDDAGVSQRELLERTLGATVIKEIDHG